MGWIPYWPNALFAEPLPSQIIAIIQRDQAPALAVVNARRASLGNPPLPAVTEFHKGIGAAFQPPWLLITANSNEFDPADYQLIRTESVSVQLDIYIGQYDQELSQDNAFGYIRMLDLVMTSAGLADWVTSLPIQHETVPSGRTVPGQVGSVQAVIPLSQELSIATVQQIEAPLLLATLRYLFVLKEGKTS